jgi:RNA polymerase sigma-70 factor (ECF subfamily)
MEDRTAEDARLVEAVLRGDQASFRPVVVRYQSLVAGVAWRFGTRRDEIEDVVSEVFLKVYKNLPLYRPEHPFSTWLYRLAANHVVDRSRRARKERGRVEIPDELADDAPRASERIEEGERDALLREALRDIDPRYRQVIFLVYVENHKVEEAARLLGLPEGTVKTRLMRGRDALRRILTRRHPEHFGGRRALS